MLRRYSVDHSSSLVIKDSGYGGYGRAFSCSVARGSLARETPSFPCDLTFCCICFYLQHMKPPSNE